jgi:Na+-transporting methylmalonyl-CoA/oxaloacetate decarboxylase gamma subunit
MDNTVVVALGITVVGMSLLFLTLVLFYGLLTLMTKVLQDQEPEPGGAIEEKPTGPGTDEAMFQAAALAVALARAELDQRPGSGSGPVGEETTEHPQVSSWWTLHHQRQLAPNPNARRAR